MKNTITTTERNEHAAEFAPARRGWMYAVAALFVLGAALISVGAGSVAIPPAAVIDILLARLGLATPNAAWPASFTPILLDIRLPRVALMAICGASLSSAGASYQAVFRNPLADPYLIGVSAGAGLGAVGTMALRLAFPWLPVLLVPAGAFAGALAAVGLTYTFGRIGRSAPTTTLVLAGVAVSAMASALTTLLLLSFDEKVAQVLAFLLGGYGAGGWDAVWLSGICSILGIATLILYARPLNALLFDTQQARQLGVDVERVQIIIILAATLMSAAAVAFCGLIGFVGLIVPHLARLLIGADHRRLLPLSVLGGAGFLMLADLAARTAIAPREVPLGVVTACAGAPFFLFLLRRARRAAFF